MINLLVITFAITAIYDIVLQLAKHNTPLIGGIVHAMVGDSDWYISLTKEGAYFDRHTPLAAALLAGFVAFVTQAIILSITSFPEPLNSFPSRNWALQVTTFLTITFAVSALIGLLMNDQSPISTHLFPVISNTYYEDLGVHRAMETDGMSGLVVNITLLIASQLLAAVQ